MGWGRKGLMFCEFSDPGDSTLTHTDTQARMHMHTPPPPAIVLQSRFVYLPLIWGVRLERGIEKGLSR